jgi:serine/threonine protein kinase
MATQKLKEIGRYRILGELGRGAMGVVYKAEDPVLDRPLAIKTIVIPADDADRKEYEARFTQEARAAGRLAHPSIVTIYDVGHEGEMVYMTMELLEGTDLGSMGEKRRFKVPEAVRIVEQVADALAFAHDRGVVHRDIKPPNIMIVPGGRVKIMDFGIARMRQSDLKTETGMMLGTPRYMSPEQVSGRPVDHRSDIFSLGTVLYEMLTGTKLFAGTDPSEIMYNVSHLRPVPPSRINRQVPAVLDLVVAKALEKDADERYQDAHQFAADLQACLSELGGHRTEPETTLRMDKAVKDGAAQEDDGRTRTLRIGAENGDSTVAEGDMRTRGTRLQNIIVDSNTRLALSHLFDSTAAIKRLVEPDPKDHARLIRAPQPPNILTRFWHDLELRLLGWCVLAAMIAGFIVAIY